MLNPSNIPPDDFFKKVANFTPSLIAVYNIQNGEYIFINDSLNKILGYKPSEWLEGGLNYVTSLVHPDDLPRIHAETQKALNEDIKTKTPLAKSPILNFEYRIKHKNGKYHWLHTDGTVFSKDKNGQVEYIINVSLDITRRKEIEEQLTEIKFKLEQKIEERTKKLIESEERYKAFMAQSSEAIWRFELEKPIPVKSSVKKQLDHFYKYAYLAEGNKALLKMYGFSSLKSLLGARLGDFLIRTDPKNVEYLTSFIKSGYRLTDAESHEKDKFGNDKYFLNSLVGICEKGYLLRAWGTQVDVTERKQIQERISESESRLQSIIDGSSQVIFVKDISGKYILINKQYETRYNISRENIKGRTDFDFFPKEVALQVKDNDEEVLKTGMVLEKEEVVPLADRIATYLTIKFPLRDKNGKIYAICGIATDITERKQLENQKDEFISVASHELKTPITTIKGYSEILKMKFKNPEAQRYIEKITTEIDRLTSLINDLLDVSRIQRGKLSLKKEKWSLNQTIVELIEDMQNISPTHKLIFENGSDLQVEADKHRISQVLINLISNAVKYSPQSKEVIITTQSGKKETIISVKDFGIGISPRDRSKIFEPFYQARNNIRRSFQGLGLGLHISNEIVLSHGGKLWVDSQRGQGSTFSFSLPLIKR
jgi:PAS domain S-box-containing protein